MLRKILKKSKVVGLFSLMICCLLIYAVSANFEIAVPTTAGIDEESTLPVIILDAGHGGADGGAVSVNGVPEKGINLDIVLTLRDMLESMGYQVELTRDEDESIHDEGVEGIGKQKKSDMKNRLELFNKYPNAIAICVHQNQFTSPSSHGAQMFYSDKNARSQEIAQTIQDRFTEFLQPENTREIKCSGEELYLLYYCNNPAVLVECGFLSNPEEAALLEDPAYRKKVAFTICTALTEYISENYQIT